MKYGFAIILAKPMPIITPSLLGYAPASTSGISIMNYVNLDTRFS
jgi:hypothetical protein